MKPDSCTDLPWGGKKYAWGEVEVWIDMRHTPHTWTLQLPHSCDEWVIGSSLEEITKFKNNLEAAYLFITQLKETS